MTFVVTENCIKCKFTACVDVCPVDCFHDGPNFLVIDPDECIDCTLCEPECPANAIFAGDELPEGQEIFLELNAEFSKQLPSITEVKSPLEGADGWNGISGKISYLLGTGFTEEDLQAGLVSTSVAERVRSIRLIKELTAVQVESLLIDVDVSVRVAILKRNDFSLNEKQIEHGLTDPSPEVQLACLQREDCNITLKQFNLGLDSTNEDVRIAYTKHHEYKLTPEQIEAGLTASSSLVKLAYLERPDVILTPDQVIRGLTDPDTKIQRSIYQRPECVLGLDQIQWVIEHCSPDIAVSLLNQHKKKLDFSYVERGFPSQHSEIRLFFAELTTLDYPADFIEQGLTDTDANVRAAFSKRKDFTPSTLQVSRWIKDAEVVVRRAFFSRKDVVIPPEDKFQMYIDALIAYEKKRDEENVEKLIQKIKIEGGQFTLESDEGDEGEWIDYCDDGWLYPSLSITYTLKLNDIVISEWISEWAYDFDFEVTLIDGGNGEEYPLIRELAGFEMDGPDELPKILAFSPDSTLPFQDQIQQYIDFLIEVEEGVFDDQEEIIETLIKNLKDEG